MHRPILPYQAVVTRLQEDVRNKNSHLRAVQSEIQAIRDQIEERYICTAEAIVLSIIKYQLYRNNGRQLFMSKGLYMDEVRGP